MKSISYVFLVLFLMCANLSNVSAQSQEAKQLLLNVEKLAQLKNILSDMKKGYQIVSSGYNSVKNIAQGNFSLHEVFLDGLMLVSPEVRKYYKIAEIISDQKDMVTEYRSALKRFSSSGNFNPSELDYLGKVYRKLADESLDNLDLLATVITAGKLRMDDDERLQAIDRIHNDVADKLIFLRSFNKKTSILNLQRQREKLDVSGLQKFYNPK